MFHRLAYVRVKCSTYAYPTLISTADAYGFKGAKETVTAFCR